MESKMEYNRLVELVKTIKTSSGEEKEVDALVSMFLENVPDPGALDYLFAKEYENLTAEQIVNKALSYRSFYL